MDDIDLRNIANVANGEVPERPRLAAWVSLVELGDGRLQLRAADFAFTIPDPLLADVVRHLRPLLDGTRSREEIETSGGEELRAGTIRFVLKVLRQRGVLQEGALPPDLDEELRHRFADSLRFLGHYVADPERVLASLRRDRVALTGDAILAGALSRALLGLGVGEVATWEPRRSPGAEVGGMVVALARTPARAFFERVNTACLASGERWLRVALEGASGVLGPTIVPKHTACYRCLVLRRATFEAQGDLEALERHALETDERDEGDLAPITGTVVSQAALEVARLLTGFAPPVTFGRQFVFDAASPRVSGHEVLRVPRCPSCGRKQSPRDPWDTRARKTAERG